MFEGVDFVIGDMGGGGVYVDGGVIYDQWFYVVVGELGVDCC